LNVCENMYEAYANPPLLLLRCLGSFQELAVCLFRLLGARTSSLDVKLFHVVVSGSIAHEIKA
jgi:hypothetical protein